MLTYNTNEKFLDVFQIQLPYPCSHFYFDIQWHLFTNISDTPLTIVGYIRWNSLKHVCRMPEAKTSTFWLKSGWKGGNWNWNLVKWDKGYNLTFYGRKVGMYLCMTVISFKLWLLRQLYNSRSNSVMYALL